eukprot:6213664-Pleurochrysis_carterae.AAC.4
MPKVRRGERPKSAVTYRRSKSLASFSQPRSSVLLPLSRFPPSLSLALSNRHGRRERGVALGDELDDTFVEALERTALPGRRSERCLAVVRRRQQALRANHQPPSSSHIRDPCQTNMDLCHFMTRRDGDLYSA